MDIFQKIFKADLLFWSTLGMSSCARPVLMVYFDGCISKSKKIIFCFNSLMKFWTFINSAFWLLKRIFDNKLKPKNFVLHGNYNGNLSITIQSFSNSVNGWGIPPVGQYSVNVEHRLKSKLAWTLCKKSIKLI